MLMLKLRTTQLRGRRAGKNETTAPMLGDSSDTETKRHNSKTIQEERQERYLC